MNYKVKSVIVLAILVCVANIGFTQGFIQANGKYITNEKGEKVLLRGMGLGGWMLHEPYMMGWSDLVETHTQFRNKLESYIGKEKTESFYTAWLQNSLRKIDIDSMAAWGFNSIRLPMHYRWYTLSIEDEPVKGQNTWLKTGFELTDSLLAWCKANRMYLILDLHGAPGGQGENSSISDYDPKFPSLWQSDDNKQKTVALWNKLAQRYANEEWIGGYDLLNESNWSFKTKVLADCCTDPDNTPLRDLLKRISDTIRSVDNKHIIFLEGNCWAANFEGIAPLWDKNLVISFHKYWSKNDTAEIAKWLVYRQKLNAPLWVGESGENSNHWFRDAIKLLEDNEIGWAWWPEKKINSVVCPLTILPAKHYYEALGAIGGSKKMSIDSVYQIMIEQAKNSRFENCIYRPDVIDAMFRQIADNTSKPFKKNNIPGILFCTEYDLGTNNVAYFDTEFQKTGGSTTNEQWNKGWIYRNDGVDIEACTDVLKTNGYAVTVTASGEWLNYSINIVTTGKYDINVRLASSDDKGKFHIEIDGKNITGSVLVANTGGKQKWKTTTIQNIDMLKGLHVIKLYVEEGNIDFNYLELNPKKK